MSDAKKDKGLQDGFSRRSVLGLGSAAVAAAALAGLSAQTQTRKGAQKAEVDPAGPSRNGLFAFEA